MFLMFLQYTPHHIPTYHIWTYRLCPSFFMWSLSFGATNSSFMVFLLLKCTWMPYFLSMFLKLSLSPLLYGTVIEVLLVLLLLLILLMFLFCFGVFFSISSSVWPVKDTCMMLMLFLHMLTLLSADLDWSRCFCSM